jgi:hypothetical protein
MIARTPDTSEIDENLWFDYPKFPILDEKYFSI